MNFLYNTTVGRILLRLLVCVFISKAAGHILSSFLSKPFINSFVRRNNIDLSQYDDAEYKSFNHFFTRKIKPGLRSFPDDANILPAPCDSKLSVYNISEDSCFHVKQSLYSLHDLLQDTDLAERFNNGYCFIFRLTPDDYHRYSYIDNGEILEHKIIPGVLHTVRPIAVSHSKFKVFSQNAREYVLLDTKNFGQIVQMEVGAMFVGKIRNLKTSGTFLRGEEKGMFEFGGSTVILLVQKDTVIPDKQIISDTENNIETVVSLGMPIGKKI